MVISISKFVYHILFLSINHFLAALQRFCLCFFGLYRKSYRKVIPKNRKIFILITWSTLQLVSRLIHIKYELISNVIRQATIVLLMGELLFGCSFILDGEFWYKKAKSIKYWQIFCHLFVTSFCRGLGLEYLLKIRYTILLILTWQDFWFSRLFFWAGRQHFPVSEKYIKKRMAFAFSNTSIYSPNFYRMYV